jgi:maleamate amidohydrolase
MAATTGSGMANELTKVRERGFGNRVGFGKSPALLIVDFTKAFTAVESNLGADMALEIAEANRLLRAAHDAKIPVYLSTIANDNPCVGAGIWRAKIAGLGGLVTGSEGVEQDSRLERIASDHILVKRFASCFFDTSFADDLRTEAVDTIIVAGCTTSGCVRASAVDACSHGFHTVVAREATADRLTDAHHQSLADLDLKYADVMPIEAILDFLKNLADRRRLAA